MSKLVSALLITLFLVACSSVEVPLDPAPRIGLGPPEAQPAYRLQPGDVVELHLASNPELNEQVIVAPDGRVTFQYAAGVQAAGRSLADLTGELNRVYRTRDNGLQVVLRSQVGTRVYVVGEVLLPSEIVANGQISALSAISRAGGFKITAQPSELVLIRRDETNRPKVYAINLEAAMTGRDPAADVLLQPYDVLYVPRDRFSNVSLVFEKVRNALPFSASVTYGIFR
jgi:protein involved in polysaccharide export with SLBB domain